MTRSTLFVLSLTLALQLTACAHQSPTEEPQKPLVTEEKPGAGVPATAIPAEPERLGEPGALPANFQVQLQTTAGKIVVQVHREWAPIGAQRFHDLVSSGYYTDIAFFRVIPGFMAQFGIHGDPATAKEWEEATIADDPVNASNKRGTIVFATAGPNTRTTQLFINYNDNSRLDAMGFSPFGEIISGMEVVDALHGDYGEGAPGGKGPDQGKIQSDGNAYLRADFPNLDYLLRAFLVDEST